MFIKNVFIYFCIIKIRLLYYIESSLNIIETPKILLKPNNEIIINFLSKIEIPFCSKVENLHLKLIFPFEINSNFHIFFEKLDNNQFCFEKKLYNESLCQSSISDPKKTFFCQMKKVNLETLLYIKLLIILDDYNLIEEGLLKNLYIGLINSKEDNSIIFTENNSFFPFYIPDSLQYKKILIEDINIIDTFKNSKSELINQNFPLIIKINKKKNARKFLFQILDKNPTLIKELILEEKFNFRKDHFYRFSDDSESTCEVLYLPNQKFSNKLENYKNLSRKYFNCYYEDFRQISIFFEFEKNFEIENYNSLYFKINVKSPSIPSKADLYINILSPHINIFLDTHKLEDALSSFPINFVNEYPKLIISSNFDTSDHINFPDINIYATSENLPNFIVANHLKFIFKITYPLANLNKNCYYSIKINMNLNMDSKILKNFFYHNLPIINGYKDLEIIEENSNSILVLNFIDSLENDLEYFIGIRVILNGTENLNFDNGENSFGNIKIILKQKTTLLETDIIEKKNLFNLTNNFKVLKIQQNIPIYDTKAYTLLHTLSSNAINSDFYKINDQNKAGLIYSKTPQFFFFSTNYKPIIFFADETTLEFILPKSVRMADIVFIPSLGIGSNCLGFVRDHNGVLKDQVERCFFLEENSFNRVFLTFKSSNAFSNLNSRDYYIGFYPVIIDFRSSFYGDDDEFKILDAYIKIYNKLIIEDFSILKNGEVQLTPDFEYFTNLYVRDENAQDQFQNLEFFFENYYEKAGYSNFSKKIPVLLRITNILPIIDLRLSQKIILYYSSDEFEFFNQKTQLTNPSSSNLQTSCSTKINTSHINSRCTRHIGISEYNCGGNTCKNNHFLSRLEIELPTELFTYSSTKPFQILLPVTIKGDFINNIMLASAKNSSFLSSLAGTNILSYTILNNFQKPSSFFTDDSTIFLDNPFLTSAIFYKSGAVFLNILGGRINNLVKNSNIEIQCKENFCKPTLSTDEYFSFTICFPFIFAGDNFFINNEKINQHQQCVFDINYFFGNEERFCVFCPVFSQGQESKIFEMTNFFVNRDNLKGEDFSDKSFVAINGVYNQFGLYRITQLNLTDKKFSNPEFLEFFEITPKFLSINYENNLFLNLKLKTNFILKRDYIIIFKTDKPNGLPFTEGKCKIKQIEENDIDCKFKKIDNFKYYIKLNENLKLFDFNIKIYGIDIIKAKIGTLPYNLNIKIDITSEEIDNLSNDKRILLKSDEDFNLIFENKLFSKDIIVKNFFIKSISSKIRNKICLDILMDFGKEKRFNSEEYFILDLTDSFLKMEFKDNKFCKIYNSDFEISNIFSICDLTNYPKIKFFLNENENILFQFIICLNGLTLSDVQDTSSLKIELFNTKNDIKISESSEFKIKPELEKIFNFVSLKENDILDSKIEKNYNYYGIYTNLKIELKFKEIISYKKIIFQIDNCFSLNSALKCYEKILDENKNLILKEILCTFYDDNNIEMTDFNILKKEEKYIFEIHNVLNCISENASEKYYFGLFENNDLFENSNFPFYDNFEIEVNFTNQISQKILKSLIIINSIDFLNNEVIVSNSIKINFETNFEITEFFQIKILFFYDFSDYGINCSVYKIKDDINFNIIEKCEKINRNIIIYIKKNEIIEIGTFELILKNIGNAYNENCRVKSPEIYFIKDNIIESYIQTFLINQNFGGFFLNKKKNSFFWENPLKLISNIINIAELNSKNLLNNFFTFETSENKKITFKNEIKNEENFGNKIKKFYYKNLEKKKLNFEIKNIQITLKPLINKNNYSLLHNLKIKYYKKKFTLLINNEITKGNFYTIKNPYKKNYEEFQNSDILFDKKNGYGVKDVLFSIPFNVTDSNIQFEIFIDENSGIESNSKILSFSLFRNYFFISFEIIDILKFENFLLSHSNLKIDVKFIHDPDKDIYNNFILDKKINFLFYDSEIIKNNFENDKCFVTIGNILENSFLVNYNCYEVLKIYFYIMPKKFFKDFKFSKLSQFLNDSPFQNFENLIIFGFFKPLKKLADNNINILLEESSLLSNYQYTVKFFLEQKNKKTEEFIYNFTMLKSTNNNFKINFEFENNFENLDKKKILCLLSHKFSYPILFIQDEEGNNCDYNLFLDEKIENEIIKKKEQIYPLEIININDIKEKNEIKIENFIWTVIFEEIRIKTDNKNIFSTIQKMDKEKLTSEIGILLSEKINSPINLKKVKNPIYYTSQEIILNPNLNLYYIKNVNIFYINQLEISKKGYLYYLIFDITLQNPEVLKKFILENYNFLLFLEIQQKNEENYFFSENLLQILYKLFPIPSNFVTFGKFEVKFGEKNFNYQLINKDFNKLLPGKTYLWTFCARNKRNFFLTSQESELVFKIISLPDIIVEIENFWIFKIAIFFYLFIF